MDGCGSRFSQRCIVICFPVSNDSVADSSDAVSCEGTPLLSLGWETRDTGQLLESSSLEETRISGCANELASVVIWLQ